MNVREAANPRNAIPAQALSPKRFSSRKINPSIPRVIVHVPNPGGCLSHLMPQPGTQASATTAGICLGLGNVK